MTRPDLDAIRARCEAATPGPWSAGHPGVMNSDTLFCAHARTDIPALLAYVEELESRGTYTVGETELANRIAHAEQRYLDAVEECEQQAKVWEQAMAEAQTDMRELRARIQVLESSK